MMRWLVLAVIVASAAPTPAGAEGLTGQLLVATDVIGDPRFAHTVIYMIKDDDEGAMGFIVNRPVGTTSLARIVESLGFDSDGVEGDVRLHYGGPVEPAQGIVLHGSDYTGPGTKTLGDGVAATTDPGIFAAMAQGRGPRHSLFTFGYAAWAPGQLADELKRDAWITVPADTLIIFDDDDDGKWSRAMARRKIQL